MTDIDPKETAKRLQADPLLKEGQRGPRWVWIALGLSVAIVVLTLVTVSTGMHEMARQPQSAPPITTGAATPSGKTPPPAETR
jgi:hypothetical protein